ncbi:MAG: phage major capsid protein [Chloroflexota bacterium]
MSFKLKGLKEKRAKLAADIRAIGVKIGTEERAMSADEKTAFEKLKTDFVAVGDAIAAATADIQALDALLAADAGDPAADPPADPAADPAAQMNSRRPGAQNRDHRPPARGEGAELAQRNSDRATVFKAWARAQYGIDLTPDQRAACKRNGFNPRSKVFTFRIGGAGSILKRGVQRRTMTAASNPTIAQGFSGAMESALLDFSNVRGVVDEFTTGTGAALPYPTEDDTTNEGEIIGESAEVNFTDPTLSSVTFNAYKFSSKGVLVPYELLEDSEFDLETWLGEKIGTRIGRIQGRRFTTGTGTGQPQGIVTASTLGYTTAGAAAWTAPELTRLAFSVDRAYRSDPSFGYMMHDTGLAYSLLLVDGQQRPLLRDSYRDGIQDGYTLNGYPIHVNQYMEPLVANVPVTAKKHVLAGAFGKFKVRDVGTVRVRRLDERYAEKDQTGFIGFARADSRLINTGAVKHMLQA